MLKILTIVGARPQFVKLAPVLSALAGHSQILPVVVHTGQHFDPDMSDVFFTELGLPQPDHYLGINGGSHASMTARMLVAIEAVILEERPDIVLVVGDTNSTLAGALAASKLHVPIAHLEAGLRSFNRLMPEETNRVLTDHMSEWLFCPTHAAVKHLADENIMRGVHHVGDVMYDAVIMFRDLALTKSRVVERLGLRDQHYAVATVHRAENTDNSDRLSALLAYIRAAADPVIVMPLHPRTRQKIASDGLSLEGIKVIDPVGYLDMLRLISGAQQVLTDSGGLQKEAYFLGRPCVTLRDETEWTETVTHGWNRLWRGPEYVERRPITDYGEGTASNRIAAIFAAYASQRPQ